MGAGGCGPGSRAPGSPSGGPGWRGRARVPASERGDLLPPSCRSPGACPGGTSWQPREHPLLPDPHPGCPQHAAGRSSHSWAVFCGLPDTTPARPVTPHWARCGLTVACWTPWDPCPHPPRHPIRSVPCSRCFCRCRPRSNGNNIHARTYTEDHGGSAKVGTAWVHRWVRHTRVQ